jgi:hypothetical protein
VTIVKKFQKEKKFGGKHFFEQDEVEREKLVAKVQ